MQTVITISRQNLGELMIAFRKLASSNPGGILDIHADLHGDTFVIGIVAGAEHR